MASGTHAALLISYAEIDRYAHVPLGPSETWSVIMRADMGRMLGYSEIVATGPGTDLACRPLTTHLESAIDLAWRRNAPANNAARRFLGSVRNRSSI